MTKELLLLSLYLALIAFLLASRRTHAIRAAALAFGLALCWTVLVGSEYNYNTATASIIGINLYAVIGWSLGLLVGYILYSYARKYVRWQRWWQKLLLFNLIYLPLLIAVESIAYHGFNVINVATANYAGLPLCDCLHAPLWMQVAYLAMGSIYFMITSAIKVHSARFAPSSAQVTA